MIFKQLNHSTTPPNSQANRMHSPKKHQYHYHDIIISLRTHDHPAVTISLTFAVQRNQKVRHMEFSSSYWMSPGLDLGGWFVVAKQWGTKLQESPRSGCWVLMPRNPCLDVSPPLSHFSSPQTLPPLLFSATPLSSSHPLLQCSKVCPPQSMK